MVPGTATPPEVISISWAMQFPDTIEPIGRGQNQQQGGANAQVRALLDGAFTRGDRDDRPRSNDGSISMALSLMNGRFVTDRVKTSVATSTVGKLLAAKLSTAETVRQLYLATLSREPASDELNRAVVYLGSPLSSSKLEDLQFALINKVDFIFNY